MASHMILQSSGDMVRSFPILVCESSLACCDACASFSCCTHYQLFQSATRYKEIEFPPVLLSAHERTRPGESPVFPPIKHFPRFPSSSKFDGVVPQRRYISRLERFFWASISAAVTISRALPRMMQNTQDLHRTFFLTVNHRKGCALADDTLECARYSSGSAWGRKGVDQKRMAESNSSSRNRGLASKSAAARCGSSSPPAPV